MKKLVGGYRLTSYNAQGDVTEILFAAVDIGINAVLPERRVRSDFPETGWISNPYIPGDAEFIGNYYIDTDLADAFDHPSNSAPRFSPITGGVDSAAVAVNSGGAPSLKPICRHCYRWDCRCTPATVEQWLKRGHPDMHEGCGGDAILGRMVP